MAFVNGVAAVLVVFLLVVGSLMLFHSHHQTTTTGSHATPLQPEKMLPPSRCGTFPLDPGEMLLCQSGQFNELDLNGSVGDYTINVFCYAANYPEFLPAVPR
jgi:hypothetical protein